MHGLLVIVGDRAEATALTPVLSSAKARGTPVRVLASAAVTGEQIGGTPVEVSLGVGSLGALAEQIADELGSAQGAAVLVAGGSPVAVAAAFAAREVGRRLCVVAAGAPSQGRTTVLRLADAVIAPDGAGLAALLREGAAAERTHVVGLGDARALDLALDVRSASSGLPSDGDHTGRDLGDEEIALVAQAIRSGTLNSTRGTFVTRLEKEFAQRYGSKHAIACASGSAAVHCAIAALKLEPGDEVITTPITDMGALTPIVYEGGMPVFADVDPTTMNVTAATIAARITPRTKAIVATHLFGQPCEMGAILALGAKRGIPVIEDTAQAFLAESEEGRVGTLGRIGCFSFQQGKHMTTGEGGIVVTDDDAIARHVFLFVNKAWGYGDPKPDHGFPALNYRLTELQGAVAVAQLEKLEGVVERRRAVAAALTEALADLPGLTLPEIRPGTKHTFWKYPIMVDPERVDGGVVALGGRLKESGVFCVPRYIQKPAFDCALFGDWNAHAVLRLCSSPQARGPAPMPTYRREDFPGAYSALARVLVLPINEKYTEAHVNRVADTIRKGVESLATCS